MLLTPDRYSSASVRELLVAAASGRAGLDRRWLRAILDRGENAVPELVRFALEPGDRPVDLTPELIGLFHTLKSPAAMPYLVNLVREETEDLPDDVLDAILAIGAPAIPPLLDLYEELGQEGGSEVAFLLAAMRVRDERILSLLTGRLETDPEDAVFCLGLHGDPAALPALEDLLARTPAGSEDNTLRRNLEQAIEDLRQPREPEDIAPWEGFEHYPETAEPQWTLLSEEERLDALRSGSPETRSAAAASFFNEDLSETARALLLDAARDDADPDVRGRAWEALYTSLDQADVHQAAVERFRSGQAPPAELGGLLVALAELASEPDVRPVLLEAYNEPFLRAKALEAMWRSGDAGFADLFPPNLEAEDAGVRRQAIWGTGRLRISSELARLRAMFDDDEFREDALFAYALASPADDTPARMKALFRKIDELAGGMAEYEAALVGAALDDRLAARGRKPVFSDPDAFAGTETPPAEPVAAVKAGRNDPCPCGSGKKFKKCCGR